MTPGQHVRVRRSSHLAQRNDVPADAEGVVICSYRVRARLGSPERIDVRLACDTVVWGVAAEEFEPVESAFAHAS